MKKKVRAEEFAKFHVTENDLRHSSNIVKYRINGRIYKFSIPEVELYEEVPCAFCLETREWVWLYPKTVFVKGKGAVSAEKIG